MTQRSDNTDGNSPSRWAHLPTDFLWSASTSAYQIEGAIHEDGRTPSIWDQFAAIPGKIYQNQTGEIADEHYHRVEEDLDLLARLGLNSYCFSIAWSRVLPEGNGAVNMAGLDFYNRLVDGLLRRNITPIAKLYHWDLPAILQDRGGWENRDTATLFADYAEVVSRHLGDRVDWWITHNEPWCVAYLGYGMGIHAPGLQNHQAAVNAGHHVLLSHGLAVPRLRAHTRTQAHIGLSLDMYPTYAADERPETLAILDKADAYRNRWFFDPIFKKRYDPAVFEVLRTAPPPIQPDDLAIISTPIDFLGLNYYSRAIYRGSEADTQPPHSLPFQQIDAPTDLPRTAMNWEIYPQGLLEILERIHEDYHPPALLITESGAAFEDEWDGCSTVHDPRRVEYLQQHIQVIDQALSRGIPVCGYSVWSLLDNYEWAHGYSKRFGLVYVDFPTQQRIIKESGHWYAAFLEELRQQQALSNS